VISWSQTATPRELDAEQLWRTLDALVTRILTEADVNPATELAGVGCGCGGPMEWPAGKVSPLNIPAWQAFPLRDRLRERFGGLAVRLHNDAICLAAGEHWRGAGRGRTTMLGIVVSTGVGGGLVLDGRLINGATGNAGHIGHVVVDPDGPPCVCGGAGLRGGDRPRSRPCRLGPGPGMAARSAAGHGQGPGRRRRAGTPDRAESDAPGRPRARHRHRLGDGPVRPGGGLDRRRALPAGSLLFDPLEEALRRHVGLDFARDVAVVPAALGQSAGLVGAAALLFAADRYWGAE
jgi:glucokinase